MVYAALAKLKKNSVSTTLSAGISAVATTIPVTDTAVFHDADSVLIKKGIVIGYDDSVESASEEITITAATTVSGPGNLTGATRGIKADGTDGIAKAWISGTNIAVMFSTGIYDQICDNIAAHESGKAPLASPTFTGTPAAPTAAVDTDTTQIATTAFVNDQLDRGVQPPTLVALAPATQPVKGGVFNGGFELAPAFTAVQTASALWIDGTAAGSATIDQYGWYGGGTAAFAVSFDTTVSRSGKNSLKLSNTNASGLSYAGNTSGTTLSPLSKYCPLLKASTKYRLTFWVKTNNVAASAAHLTLNQYDISAVIGTTITTTKISGTNDWASVVTEFTSDADAGGSYARIFAWNYVAGNVSDAWFDDITLEEIVEDASFTGTIPTPVRPTLVGVTTTDNIDQSLDSGWAAAQHYDLTTDPQNEGATHIQTFTPTRNKVAKISVKVIAKGTGNWSMVLHDATNNILSNKSIANASLADNTVVTFNTGYLWTTGALHFHLSSTVADGTVLTTGVHDLETCSYIQYYAKPMENATAICNGEEISLSADQDGILSGAIIDLNKGKYLYAGATAITDIDKFSDIYSASSGGYGSAGTGINNWMLESINGGYVEIYSANDGTTRNFVYKVNTILPVRHLKIKNKIFSGAAVDKVLQISPDNINWTTIRTVNTATMARYSEVTETDLVNGLSTFYIRFYKAAVNDYLIGNIVFLEADLDTSTIPSIILQPLGTMPQFSDEVVLPDATSGVRLYHRAAKYANKNGVVVPHLEFCTSGAVAIKAIPCGFDNSGCTSPCIQILDINGDATGYPLHDGDYCAVSPALSNRVTYKMGASSGETISAITMNRLYLSSNGVANSATKDPSHQFNFYLGMLKHGIQKVVEKLQGAVNDIARAIHWEWGLIVASGTAYALTTTLAVINFGTTGNLEINLPDVGIYEITALVHDDMSAVTVSAAANYSLYQPYIDGVAMTNGEQMGLRTSILAAAAVGMDANTVYLSWIISSSHPGTLVSIYAKKNSATTGAWNVVSDATGWTKLRYKRIA